MIDAPHPAAWVPTAALGRLTWVRDMCHADRTDRRRFSYYIDTHGRYYASRCLRDSDSPVQVLWVAMPADILIRCPNWYRGPSMDALWRDVVRASTLPYAYVEEFGRASHLFGRASHWYRVPLPELPTTALFRPGE